MRIRAFVVLLFLVVALPSAVEAQCGKLQPTLRDYYIQEHGEGYVKGLITLPSPEEGAKCEKARYDMRYWLCMWRSAQRERPAQRFLKNEGGIPQAVLRIRAQKASQMGGEAAKRRAIQRAWKYYREDVAREASAVPRMAEAKAGYLAARSKSKASGCKVGIFGRYGTYNDRSSDKLAYGDQ